MYTKKNKKKKFQKANTTNNNNNKNNKNNKKSNNIFFGNKSNSLNKAMGDTRKIVCITQAIARNLEISGRQKASKKLVANGAL